jgi:hypothetical protein
MTEQAADEGYPPTRDIVRIVDEGMLPWLIVPISTICNNDSGGSSQDLDF